jgi:DNA modification methylase
LRSALSNTASVCRQGATAYVFHALGVAGVRIAFERAFLAAGFHLSATLIWKKPSATLGWGDYRHAAEPILYGYLGDGHRRIKDRTQSTVWEIEREANLLHLTQKPVSVMSRALRNSTIRGERVLDPFVGSGTTVIACEQLGRICYAMEIEPKYVDVCVSRWEGYTGRKAELIHLPSEQEVSTDAQT